LQDTKDIAEAGARDGSRDRLSIFNPLKSGNRAIGDRDLLILYPYSIRGYETEVIASNMFQDVTLA
jgi:hypothetical protein